MATQEEVILKIKTDLENSLKELESVKKSVENIGEASDETAKATGGIRDGLKGVGVALKAAGIGLALKAFEMLSEVFMKNQKTADFFNTAFEATSIAINDFVNFVFNNFGQVTQFFKDIFENPLGSIKDLGQAITDNIVERFNSILEVAGLVGSAIKLLFAGEFQAASALAKEYTKATVESATANVALGKQAELSAVQIQGLIEKFDRQSELLRQVRDDENATFADRIKANEDLGKVLEQQATQMLALQQIQVDAAQIEFDKLQNQENLIALTEAQNELMAIEAQITGFRSEQLTNEVSLQRELQDVKKELAAEGVSDRERELLEVEQQYAELFRLAKKAGKDTIALEKQKADAIANIKLGQVQEDAQIISESLDNIKAAAGEESEIAKVAGILQATINTYMGAAAALAPPPTGAGPLLGPILAATTVAAGIANINKIASTPTPSYAQGGIINGFGTGTSDSVNARLSNGESVINDYLVL